MRNSSQKVALKYGLADRLPVRLFLEMPFGSPPNGIFVLCRAFRPVAQWPDG
jgi:hypothetical protein